MRANCKVIGGFLTARGSVTLISMLLKVNLCVCVCVEKERKGEGERERSELGVGQHGRALWQDAL